VAKAIIAAVWCAVSRPRRNSREKKAGVVLPASFLTEGHFIDGFQQLLYFCGDVQERDAPKRLGHVRKVIVHFAGVALNS
jgi:hypothetical protein